MNPIKVTIILAIVFLGGCASIPQESVTLNKEVTIGITSIHESNIKFVNHYFELKKIEVDSYEQKALEGFFNTIAAATTKPGAPALGAQDLFRIKVEIEKINNVANSYKVALDNSKTLIIEKLQNEYNTLISANNSITGILQSAVDVDKAKNDGLNKTKELTDGKVDLTDIDDKVNDFLAKIGSSSSQATDLISSIQTIINNNSGDK